MSQKRKYRLIDLFCGAGGLTAGFAMEEFSGRFESVLALDNDDASIKTYNQNFGHRGEAENIETWLANNEVPNADVVIGGPPCQGFSLLNKNRVGDGRRALWEPFIDIVLKSGASVFLMENVPGLLNSEEFAAIAKRLAGSGFYLLSPSVINMADYGVPQTRRRAIVVGIKTKDFEIHKVPTFPPAPTHQDPRLGEELPPWVTVREAIGDLRRPKGTEIRNIDPPYDLHFGRNPTTTSKARYRAIPEGGNRFDLQRNRPDLTPGCWIRKKTGGTDLFGRLWWDRPSVTIRTEFFKPEKGRYLHPSQHRPITHREAARIMSFPDSFKFVGSKIEIARQIGNAVPPVMAWRMAEFITEILEDRLSDGAKIQAGRARANQKRAS